MTLVFSWAQRFALVVAIVAFIGIAQPATAQDTASPEAGATKVVLLPVFYEFREWTASGKMDLVPDWTEESKASLTTATESALGKRTDIQFMKLGDLTAEEQATLREHLALFKLIALNSAQLIQLGGPAWKDKKTQFDYSIGPGLAFLKERTGSDHAMIVAGAGVRSSGGRIAMGIFLAVAVGAVIPPGGAIVTTGTVDLETGNIQWFEYSMGTKGDVRQAEGANNTMNFMLEAYPQSRFLGTAKKTKAKKTS
jgi:hypothetical protein